MMKTSLFAVGVAIIFSSQVASAESQKIVVSNDTEQVIIQALTDDLLRVEYAPKGPLNGPDAFDVTSPLIYKKTFTGATRFSSGGDSFETKNVAVNVDAKKLCLNVTDKNRGVVLTKICPYANMAQTEEPQGLYVFKLDTQNIYGLGEQFKNPGQTNGDWMNQVRESVLDDGRAMKQGNRIYPFDGAGAANAQFPIMYALGSGLTNYALFMDQIPELRWDFTAEPWKIGTRERVLKFYIITGHDLPSLRRQYMDLVGHPLVPPKKAFGLWLSEFGYRNWDEMDQKLKSLRANHFPIDGMVLDALWYGSFASNGPNYFGTFQWTDKFPDPAAHVKNYKDQGIWLMLHETPWVSGQLTQFKYMSEHGYLLSDYNTHQTTALEGYLGKAGIIDYTNDEGAALWHRIQREPLIQEGIRFHWTDFAELDTYGGNDWWHGVAPFGHTADENHNLLPLKWSESIARGYDNSPEREDRHFILARSGASGIQRYGTALWSGDLASRISTLAAQMNVQTNMSLSGIDYFGSDVGGYHRDALQGDVNDVYTKWFAHSAAFDVPLRPHTSNWEKKNETAPDHIGDFNSNLSNLRLRYELSPYYYSLAHEAYLTGSPLFPPAFYYFQTDMRLRPLYDEKMIGPEILVPTAAQNGDVTRDIYLPAGDWFEYRSKKWFHSGGQSLSWTFKNDGMFVLPYFVRAGAILPIMWVDASTENIMGQRTGGGTITDLNVSIFPSVHSTHFSLFEDDGVSTDYKNGKVAVTKISQEMGDSEEKIRIAPTAGTYDGAPPARRTIVRVYVNGKTPRSVTLNGIPMKSFHSQNEFNVQQTNGWFSTADFLVVRTDSLSVTNAKIFKIKF